MYAGFWNDQKPRNAHTKVTEIPTTCMLLEVFSIHITFNLVIKLANWWSEKQQKLVMMQLINTMSWGLLQIIQASLVGVKMQALDFVKIGGRVWHGGIWWGIDQWQKFNCDSGECDQISHDFGSDEIDQNNRFVHFARNTSIRVIFPLFWGCG
jgi:hypothetical protein